MIFDIQRSMNEAPVRLTPEYWQQLIHHKPLEETVDRIAAGEKELKKSLPAICWQASFGGKKRANENAIPSGLYMLDIDHVSDMPALREQLRQLIKEKNETLGIMVVHITPSGAGYRIVAKMKAAQGFSSIADYQRWLATQLGIADYDACTKDLARLSFAVPAKNILYFDAAIWSAEPEATVPVENQPSQSETPALPAGRKMQTTYQGHPLSEIWLKLVNAVVGKPIEEGDRNSNMYRTALLFRYICDNNPAVMAANIPSYGLSPQEVLQTLRSATRYDLSQAGLARMTEYLQEFYPAAEAASEAESDDDTALRRPVLNFDLPPIFSDFVNTAPTDFREVMLMCMLPVLGTVATKIRASYLDGTQHSPSFFTVLEAPQASGKGFLRTMVHTLTERIRLQDTAQRALEQQYREELRRTKNKAKQPEDPKAVIRLVPATISIAMLLRRMDYAQGRHLFTFCEEIDTISKTNSGGSWSQKSDIYRNAFDNAEYGQDYLSDNSYSAVLPMYYNLLTLGTPRAVARFFKDPEDGLCSRVIFAQLPDQFAQTLPEFKSLTTAQLKEIDEIVCRLMDMEGTVNMNFIHQEVADWLDERRLQALRSASSAVDIFRRRAAVIGFRAALLASAIYGKLTAKQKQTCKSLFRFVADYTLYYQVQRYGDKLDEMDTYSKPKSYFADLFESVPKTFTNSDLGKIIDKLGIKSPAKMIIYRWRKSGLIKKVGSSFEKK